MTSRPPAPHRRLPAIALLVSVAAALTACDAAPTGPHPDTTVELRALNQRIDALTEETVALRRDLRRRTPRAAAEPHTAPVATAVPIEPAAATDAALAALGAPPTDSVATTPAAAEQLAEVLATPDGRKAVEQAARRIAGEQAARQRDTFVAYSLAKFADEAGLDDFQRGEMKQVWDDVMADARKLMGSAKGLDKLPEAERAERMAALRTGMQDIGRRRTERVRAVLSAEQFELYEERQDEIDAGLHGAPAGGRRGRGQRETGAADR